MRVRHLIALTGALSVSAWSAAEAPPQAVSCQACHGAEGISSAGNIPNLAGQKRDYLAQQLDAFRSGARKNDLMAAIASQLSAEDVQRLAAYWSALPAAGSTAGTGAAPLASAMTLPADFPKGFTEYEREQQGKVVTIRYANAPAWQAAREGKPLPDGSALISATHQAEMGADGKPLLDAQGRWRTGPARNYSGMASHPGWGDAVPALLRNGNWQYGLWSAQGQSRLGALHAQCLACHKPKEADSYVFTLAALRKAATAR